MPEMQSANGSFVLKARRLAGKCRDAVVSGLIKTASRLHHGDSYIRLDYPPTALNVPRYGHDKDEHAILNSIVEAGAPSYSESLDVIASYTDDLRRIPDNIASESDPSWGNPHLPGLDGAALYSFVREFEPATYLEVGSGNSTKFVARAIADGDVHTRIVSIDPSPRAAVDAMCDEVIRAPMETVDLEVFATLRAGDIVFFDGSHRVFMNSDTTVFFLDVLPSLPKGVLVGIHDIFLPRDYPTHFARRYYSEQYLLAGLLLADTGWLEPVLAADWASRNLAKVTQLADIWTGITTEAPHASDSHGAAYWLRIGTRGGASS